MDTNIVQANDSQAILTPQIESVAKIASATAIAQTLSFSTERKFLEEISSDNNPLCKLNIQGEVSHSLKGFKWLRFTQVGRFSEGSLANCFDTMRVILQATALPNTTLAFVINGEKGVYKMYIGLKGVARITGFKQFMENNWRGVLTETKESNDKTLDDVVSGNKYENCYCFTGIPTMSAKDKYARTIEQVIGGTRSENMAYVVIANPVSNTYVDSVLNTARDMQSQAESFKSFSLTESAQKGHNESTSIADGIAETITKSVTEAQGGLSKKILTGTGVALAASIFFPPAVALAPSLLTSGTFITAANVAANFGQFLSVTGASHGLNMLSGLIPKETNGKSNTTQHTETKTKGFSESYSKSLGQTIVNAHIASSIEHLTKHCQRFERGKAVGMWEVGCYLFTSSSNNNGNLGAMQVKSTLSGIESIYEPIRIHNISEIIQKKGNINGFVELPSIYAFYKQDSESNSPIFQHPYGSDFSRLTTFLTTEELTCYINFPIRSVPGISVIEAFPDFSMTPQSLQDKANSISIGHLIFNSCNTNIETRLPIDTLSRHALISGVNGSGKTNTVLSIIDGFVQVNRPFLIIEPAKTEYVDWALKYNAKIKEHNDNTKDPSKKKKEIKIYIPGCTDYTKASKLDDLCKKHYLNGFVPDVLKFNPFEVIKLPNSEMRVLSHIDRLKATFAAAFPMQDILPVIMEHLLYDLYTNTNPMIDETDPCYMQKGFPTLDSINRSFIDTLMTNIGYAKDNTQNISAALRTRFKSLKYGWKGELLNNKMLTGISWDELFGSPVVVNLSYAGDDQDRAFIMSLLLQFLYEYRIAESESGNYSFNSNECRHLVVVEEAHRVMGRYDNPEAPQHKSGLMFSNFLSEVRAYGQGMMVVDQVPTRLIEDAIKNTNVKIVHKLVASDDARIVAECIGLTPDQQKVIPKLSIGQAILAGFNSANVSSTDSSNIYLAQINKMK